MPDSTAANELPEVLKNAENLPTMPAVAMEVLRITSDQDSTLDRLADAISRDPVLTGKILKTANSSVFGTGGKTSDLRRACMVLGMKSVKLIALSFSLAGSLPSEGAGQFSFEGYWQRAVSCAVSARSFASLLASNLVEEAFLCALMSRIGQLVIAVCMPERYSDVIEQSSSRWPLPGTEREVLGFDGESTGAALLRSWSLPEIVCDAIACMNDPSRLEADASSETRDLVRVLHLANRCEELICGPDKNGSLSEVLTLADQYYKLDQAEVEEILRHQDAALQETAEMLQIAMEPVQMEELLVNARKQIVETSLDVATEIHRVEARAGELESKTRSLEYRAERDALTGLANRGAFDAQITAAMDRARGESSVPCALLMLDIDHFKSINDRFGHPVGDLAIRHVAETIQAMVRDTDIVARYGGEEFAVILDGPSSLVLKSVGERIRAGVESTTLDVEGERVSFTISAGGAYVEGVTDAFQPPDLIEAADRCLLEAKRGGRNSCEFVTLRDV